MATILLAVKPEYVKCIFNGTKLYEYRKRSPRKEINKIIVYATSPVMKVIGEIEISNIISGSPTAIWKQTKDNSGISSKNYRKYFKGYKVAYAYHIIQTTVYECPKSLNDFGVSTPPQSFIYIEDHSESAVEK